MWSPSVEVLNPYEAVSKQYNSAYKYKDEERKINMTKSELKTGMLVELKNGTLCMVFMDSVSIYQKTTNPATDVLVAINRRNTWYSLGYYNEDLTCNDRDGASFDIVKVLLAQHPYCFPEPKRKDYNTTEIIWERKEKKRYTYAQLREILGEEFEVVG